MHSTGFNAFFLTMKKKRVTVEPLKRDKRDRTANASYTYGLETR